MIAMRRFDAIIIGGGACGCTIAYELSRAGLCVAVMDKGPIGREASWASAGMIGGETCPQRAPWYRAASVLSRAMYDDYAARFGDIGMVGRGHMVIARSSDELDELHDKVDVQSADGIEVQYLDGDAARKREPMLPEDTLGAALLPGGRSLDARRFTQLIAKAAAEQGATLFPGCAVDGLQWKNDRVIGAGGFEADWIINAAGAWAGRIDQRLTLPVYPMHGQIMVLEGQPGELQHNVSRAGGRGYLAPRGDGRILIGATHETWGYAKKVTASGAAELGAIVHRIAPHLGQRRVIDSWSGLRPASPDGMPTIGFDPRAGGRYVWAAGHGAAGMMQMPATAAVVADLVLGRDVRVDISRLRAGRDCVEARGGQFMAV